MSLKNDEGKTEAFILASLLLAVDPAEPRKILQAVVGEKNKVMADEFAFEAEPAFSNDYALPTFVRDHIL
jgi:hypothetical protein